MRYDIIITTWNSMPELEKCLQHIIQYIPEKNRGKIIIVDRHSTDGTIETAKKYGCKVIYDDISLGSARMKGIKEAKTDWIIFIDSDIYITPTWFNEMMKWLKKYQHNYNIGWIYGRTIDDREPLKSEKLYKMEIEFRNRKFRILKKGERAYTNNTIALRKPLLNAKIEHLNAWEDYILTQEMIKAGYDVIEVPVTCIHLRSDTYSKFGVMTEAWGIAVDINKTVNAIKSLREKGILNKSYDRGVGIFLMRQ